MLYFKNFGDSMFKIIEKIKNLDKFYFLIFLVSLILISPLINNLYFEGHDTGYHIANILAISENLSFQNILNLKIFPLIANNFGYGSGIFYPQFSHIFVAFIYKYLAPFNFSIFSSLKLFNFIIIFLSGIFMYHFMKTITQNNKLSFISSLFYLTMPYKIYDYLVRDAIAESCIFVFIPLIFLSIYYLLNNQDKKFYFNFIVGYIGLINSHLVMTIYVTLFLAIILLGQWKKVFQKAIITKLIIATIIVLLICLPFIITLITHKFKGSYEVFNQGIMANPFGVYGNSLYIYQYFIGWYMEIGYHFFNYIALFLAVTLLIKLYKEKKLKDLISQDYLFTIGFICTILGIWMSSHLFPWFLMPNFFIMIQFPWRLGTLTGFGLSILSFYALKIRNNSSKIIFFSILSCILIFIFCSLTQQYQKITPKDYDLSTLGMGWQQEYLPTKTKENIKYFNERLNDIIVTKGNAKVTNLINDTPFLKFRIETNDKVLLELPRLYYLGYQITAIYDNYQEQINYQESENGFIEIEVEKSAIIELDYKGTTLAQLGNKISLITIIIFGLFIILKKR